MIHFFTFWPGETACALHAMLFPGRAIPGTL